VSVFCAFGVERGNHFSVNWPEVKELKIRIFLYFFFSKKLKIFLFEKVERMNKKLKYEKGQFFNETGQTVIKMK